MKPTKFTYLVQIVVYAALAAAVVLSALRWGIAWAILVLFPAYAAGALICLALFMVLPAEWARRRRLAGLAAQRGWSYHRQHDPAMAARLPSFLIPEPWTSHHTFCDVVAGQAGGRPFLSFSRRYSFSVSEPGVYGEGQTAHSVFHWVVLVAGLPTPLPTICCRTRRPLPDPGMRHQPSRPQEFPTGVPAFDGAFCLEGPADLLASGLAAQIAALMPRLAASIGREFSWQVTEGVLATWQAGGAYTDPGLIEPVLAALQTIADLISGAVTNASARRPLSR